MDIRYNKLDWLTIGCDPVNRNIVIFLSETEEIATKKIELLEKDPNYEYFLFQIFWIPDEPEDNFVEPILSFLRNCGIPRDHAIKILDVICEMLSGK